MVRLSGDGIAWLTCLSGYPAALRDGLPGMEEKASRNPSCMMQCSKGCIGLKGMFDIGTLGLVLTAAVSQ